MAGLPKILDVRDDLRRAEEATDGDIREETEDVLASLAAYAGDASAGSGNLDEADEELLRLEERTDSDVAAERLQAARNRIRIFRESLSGGGDDLLVIHADRTGADDGTAVESTVVNNVDAPVTGTVTVAFYDGDGTELGTATSEETEFDANEEKPVTVRTEVPAGTERYVTEATRSDAGGE